MKRLPVSVIVLELLPLAVALVLLPITLCTSLYSMFALDKINLAIMPWLAEFSLILSITVWTFRPLRTYIVSRMDVPVMEVLAIIIHKFVYEMDFVGIVTMTVFVFSGIVFFVVALFSGIVYSQLMWSFIIMMVGINLNMGVNIHYYHKVRKKDDVGTVAILLVSAAFITLITGVYTDSSLLIFLGGAAGIFIPLLTIK